MRKWMVLFIILAATALLSMPAMGFVSVKYIYDETWVPGDYVDVVIDQTTPVGWDIFLRRAPSGPLTMWPDTMVPIYDDRQVGRTFEIFTDSIGGPGFSPFVFEDAFFDTIPAYDVYVTITPTMDKYWYIF